MENTSGFDLSFTNLGITIERLGKSITIFGFEVAYYGIIIGIGMMLGMYIAYWNAKRIGDNEEKYMDFAIYGIIAAIVGARLYYVIFDWNSYKDNLLEILNTRGGGLAIYGGVIGGASALIIYCKVKKESFFAMADVAVTGLITGQIIGRWGNFFNCEAFGGYTNNLLAMQIRKSLVNTSMINQELLYNIKIINKIEYIQVHPTFLYESIWNTIVLIIMILTIKKKKFNGQIFSYYLIGYGIGRFMIEGLRTDQLKIGATNIAASQLLSVILVGIGIVYIFTKGKLKNILLITKK
jgi:prolipoprotein diacylglyceryl transferase